VGVKAIQLPPTVNSPRSCSHRQKFTLSDSTVASKRSQVSGVFSLKWSCADSEADAQKHRSEASKPQSPVVGAQAQDAGSSS
jgi:hypothetical protein